MQAFLTLVRRELAACYVSLVGYVIVAAVQFLMGLGFVIVLPLADADAYVSRYAQPDKERTGLGASADAWPVPYWYIDTGMAAMARSAPASAPR